MNNWNGLDFLIFLIFAANTVLGMARGATKELISALCLSVAMIFMIKFTIPLTHFFSSSPLMASVVESSIIQNFMGAIGAGPVTPELLTQIFYSISLLICFVGIFSICEAALSVAGIVEMYPFPYAAINRKLGAGLGCTRGYVITLILIVILNFHLLKGNNPLSSGSFFVNMFQHSAARLDAIITGQKPEDYREILQDKDLYKSEDVLKQLQ